MAQIGQIVDGRYRITDLLDKGGMSRVYLAADIRIGKVWVVKEVPKFTDGSENRLSVQAALREAGIIKSLDHTSIVRIVDISEDDEFLYIVEDYVRGVSLRETAEMKGTVTEEEAADLAAQLADVLAYLHGRKNPVIYRDIKPENIIVSPQGHVRLIEFGIARIYKPDAAADTGYLGTEKYAAPEQYEDYGAQTDARTDIYGLGRTLKYLSDYMRTVSPGLKHIIEKCTEQDPDDRFQTAEELKDALEHLRKSSSEGSGHGVNLVGVLLGVAAVICVLAAAAATALRAEKPGAGIDSYLEMTAEMKQDVCFTAEEEEKLMSCIMPYLDELREQDGFDALAYEIGKLYWFYYEYGNDGYEGMSASVPWFELSSDYNSLAGTLAKLGRFCRDMPIRVTESEDSGMYKEHFKGLAEIAQDISKGNEPELIRLNVWKLVVDSVRSYARKYRRDGIEYKELKNLLYDAIGAVMTAETLSPQEDDLKKSILDCAVYAVSSVDDAYENEIMKGGNN